MSSALDLSIGWGALIQKVNLKNFLILLTEDNKILSGVKELKEENCSIFCLVTILRIRPHKYLKLKTTDETNKI